MTVSGSERGLEGSGWVKIEAFIPEEILAPVQTALNAVGALELTGKYDHCMAVTRTTGYWRPIADASPYIGHVGAVSHEPELKIEFSCRAERMDAAVAAIRQVHPYEVAVINVLPLLRPPAAGIRDRPPAAETGDRQAATGDRQAATGDRQAATGDRQAAMKNGHGAKP